MYFSPFYPFLKGPWALAHIRRHEPRHSPHRRGAWSPHCTDPRSLDHRGSAWVSRHRPSVNSDPPDINAPGGRWKKTWLEGTSNVTSNGKNMGKYGKIWKIHYMFFFAGKVKSSLFLGDAPASHVTALAWLKPPFLVPTKQQNCGHKTVHKCAANEWIIMVCNYWLVVEPTSLKNMTSSVGMMTFPIHIYIYIT